MSSNVQIIAFIEKKKNIIWNRHQPMDQYLEIGDCVCVFLSRLNKKNIFAEILVFANLEENDFHQSQR